MMRTLLLSLVLTAFAAAQDRHVVLISLDGYPAYALKDPRTPAPTLRKLIREGAWAPDGMTNINPTVTWPNHTSMVTGVDATRHGVIYNGLPVRKDGTIKIDPDSPKDELVLAPTVYDLAHARGMTTAEVDWVAIEKPKTITWAFAERPQPDAVIPREMVAAGILTQADVDGFSKAPITYRDEVWTEAAVHILKVHKPNLLLFHLLTTDSSGHTYGSRSLGFTAALALADRQVERLIEAVRSAGYLDRTTFIVVSDHGFHTAKKHIRPAALLKEKGIEGVVVVSEGGTAMLYGKVSPEIFKDVEGISEVITPGEFAKYGYPPAGGRMADLVLAAKDTYAFSNSATLPVVADIPAGASSGNHGYLSTNPDMRPIFVAWGAGVKRGAHVDNVRNVDVAATIAQLLGLKLDGVAGKTISGALAGQ